MKKLTQKTFVMLLVLCLIVSVLAYAFLFRGISRTENADCHSDWTAGRDAGRNRGLYGQGKISCPFRPNSTVIKWFYKRNPVRFLY